MKRILLAIILLVTITLTGCGDGDTNYSVSTNRGHMESVYYDAGRCIYNYTDPDTGVQYIIFDGVDKGGITPRLDKHGNIMVDKER